MMKIFLFFGAASTLIFSYDVKTTETDNFFAKQDKEVFEAEYANSPSLERPSADQQMRIRVSGAKREVPLRIRNVSPSIIKIAGSEDASEPWSMPKRTYRGYRMYPYKGPPIYILPVSGQPRAPTPTQDP